MGAEYLWKRNGVYWFRRAVPADLIHRAGRTDVRRALGTADRHRVQRLARRMATVMDDWAEAVAKAKEADPGQPERALLLQMLDEALALAEDERRIGEMKARTVELRALMAE